MGTDRTSAKSFSTLQRGLTGERSLVGASYMEDPELLRVYRDYYWPVSREQAGSILRQLSAVFPGGFPSLIDVGSGPGPVAAAFLENGTADFALLDRSPKALELARSLLGHRPRSLHLQTGDAHCLADIASRIPLWGKASCISFGHSLNELWVSRDDRIALRADLLGLCAGGLAPGGIVLVIEPALLSTSRDLLAVRDILVERGWRVLAPCPGRSRLPCPALEAGPQHTCHEDISWKMPPAVEALARQANLGKETLKMTWFAFAPPAAAGTGDASDAESVDGGPFVCRVVSEAMLNKGGRLRRLVCGARGRVPLSVPASSPDARRTAFAELRRGETIRLESPEERENGWGIGAGTEIVRLSGGEGR